MDRRPFYPDDWSHSFGVPVKEHRNIVLETIDGYGFIDAPNRQEEDKE